MCSTSRFSHIAFGATDFTRNRSGTPSAPTATLFTGSNRHSAVSTVWVLLLALLEYSPKLSYQTYIVEAGIPPTPTSALNRRAPKRPRQVLHAQKNPTCLPIIPWATSEATGIPYTRPPATVTMTTPLKLDRRWLRGPACEKQVWQCLLLFFLSFLSLICTF